MSEIAISFYYFWFSNWLFPKTNGFDFFLRGLNRQLLTCWRALIVEKLGFDHCIGVLIIWTKGKSCLCYSLFPILKLTFLRNYRFDFILQGLKRGGFTLVEQHSQNCQILIFPFELWYDWLAYGCHQLSLFIIVKSIFKTNSLVCSIVVLIKFAQILAERTISIGNPSHA